MSTSHQAGAAAPRAKDKARGSQDPRDSVDISSSSSKSRSKKPEKEVTVLFYMDGQYADLEPGVASALQSLERVGSNDQMNIVAELGRVTQEQAHPEGGADRLDGDWSGVRRYYVEKGKTQSGLDISMQDWGTLLKKLPDNPILHFQMGELYRAAKQTDKADEEYRKAEDLGYMKLFKDPLNPDVKKWSKEYSSALQPFRDRMAAKNVIQSPVVEDLGDVDMMHPYNLQDFIAWGMKNYPAEHYVVVLMGHGGAWTGALQMSPAEMGSAMMAGAQDASLEKGKTETIDTLVFNSCYMGNLESLQQMKDSAKTILASEMSARSSVFHHWPAILSSLQKYLASGQEFDGAEFSRQFVELYRQQGEQMEDEPLIRKLSKESYKTLAAVDAAKIDDISKAWKKFVDDWERLGVPDDVVFRNFKDSKNYPSFAYSPEMLFDYGNLRDLGDIVHNLQKDPDVPILLKQDARAVEQKLSAAIIAEQHTGDGMEGSTGLSIWAPTNAGDISMLSKTYAKKVPEFDQNTAWGRRLTDACKNLDPKKLSSFLSSIRLMVQTRQVVEALPADSPKRKELAEKLTQLKDQVGKLHGDLELDKPANKEELQNVMLSMASLDEDESGAKLVEDSFFRAQSMGEYFQA